MNRSVFQRIAEREERDHAGSAVQDVDATDDLGCFGWARGLNARCLMLELRKLNGNVLVISYGWISAIEFNPSTGMVIEAAGHSIRIQGRNLGAEVRPGVRLLDGLARHRVPWIQEGSQRASCLADDGALLVDEMAWR